MQTFQPDSKSPGRLAPNKQHWETIYSDKDSMQVSWYKPHLELSLKLINETGVSKKGHIIDVGAGASTLADDLLAAGYSSITALDISSKALKTAQARLGKRAEAVNWIEADITEVVLPPDRFDLWHDRAAFHFLTDAQERLTYRAVVERALAPGGWLILATFAADGPERCSGLPVHRWSPEALAAEWGDGFELIQNLNEVHTTPWAATQAFNWCRFRRLT